MQLTQRERFLSAEASAKLGFPVLVFSDGDWICQPKGAGEIAYGKTPEEAIEACRKANASRPQ
jgi:hypothetical protein